MNKNRMTKKLDQYFQELIDTKRIPGCGLIVRMNGEPIYSHCMGLSDIEASHTFGADTIIHICSMTKLLIAVSIMKLVEEKKLSLNDNLVKFFPEYPEEKKRVRIRHLLNHSSSLGQLEPSNEFFYRTLDPQENLKSRVDKWADMPFDCELGESAAYSAVVNYDILGRIIEVVTGENLDIWLKENIFKPLQMNDTTYFLNEEQNTRKAACYHSEQGELILIPENHPFFASISSTFGYCSGAAGIYSTLYDYDRFTAMLANGGILDGVRIISEESLQLMKTPRQITDQVCQPGCPWGLGFMIFEEPEKSDMAVAPGTYGWSGALGTHMFIHDELGICATYMVSMDDLNGAASFISREIEKIIFEEF